ncbi:hypothetical protein JZ751_006163 [Albula glossodonta]|uniref:Uncharacterized protein n=1 Tax=Albula glossodonta TaxID=121402 RepID=A0A8T2NBG5_9TELE|nr:hypothetical protein JZ751_006163 [Albula glossodonta]
MKVLAAVFQDICMRMVCIVISWGRTCILLLSKECRTLCGSLQGQWEIEEIEAQNSSGDGRSPCLRLGQRIIPSGVQCCCLSEIQTVSSARCG